MAKQEKLIKAEEQAIEQPEVVDAGALAPVQPESMAHLMKLALTEDKAEGLQILMQINERLADRAAEQEFNVAYAKFKAECPPVAKNARADIVKGGVKKYSYDYLDTPEIERVCGPHLLANGFSYSWGDSTVENGIMTSTCTLRHVGGHSRPSKAQTPIENTSGMSAQQKFSNANTITRRQSLVNALGLVAVDRDTDGSPPVTDSTITEEQARYLGTMIDKCGGSTYGRFCRVYNIQTVGELPSRCYSGAESMLREKLSKQGGDS
jgi:hypothetical protein